jgi:lysophospholipase L1-like esterase
MRVPRVAALLLAAGSILLTLGLFELALRIADAVGGWQSATTERASRVAQLFALSTNEEIGFEHVPNARVLFPSVRVDETTTAPWEVRIDANGLRSNGRASSPAPELRGICLGDSTMFGVGLDDHETIPAQISDLVSHGLGRRFECLNFGVSNYTTAQEVAFFRPKDALTHDPSVVVLGIFTNDFKASPGRIRVLDRSLQLVSPDAAAWPATALQELHLWRIGATAILAFRDQLRDLGLYPQTNAKPLEADQIEAVYGALDDLRSLLEPRAIPLVIVLFPRDWQLDAQDRAAATERQRVSKAYCRRHGIPCIDLLDHYYGGPVESYFRPGDDSHPHAEASRTIAGLVADAVLEILSPPLDDSRP